MASIITDTQVTGSYNSLSGSDIRAYIGPYQFAAMQGISYSITREKAPIYTCGSADPRAYSRNKRGIAGSLIWITFDRHMLLDLYYKTDGTFAANIDDVKPEYQLTQNTGLSQVFASQLIRDVPNQSVAVNLASTVVYSEGPQWKEEVRPWYSDQILPFDIALAGVNEVGAGAAMKIFGVEILNESYGISVDDAVSEMQASWVARSLEPLQAVPNQFPDLVSQG